MHAKNSWWKVSATERQILLYKEAAECMFCPVFWQRNDLGAIVRSPEEVCRMMLIMLIPLLEVF